MIITYFIKEGLHAWRESDYELSNLERSLIFIVHTMWDLEQQLQVSVNLTS